MDKNNKNPEVRFKGFTDDWEEKLLADEVDFFTGLTYSPSNVVKNGGTLVLRSSNVKNSQVVLTDNVFVESEVVNCENVIVGDIIIVVRNGSRNLIGKHALIKKNMPNTVIGAFMTGIHSKQPDFINSLLDTNQFEKEIEKNLGATINQITTGALKKMTFWFPKEDEQKQIGTFFQNLDNLITLHQKKYDKLVILKKAMLVKMFPKKGALVPEIRFKGFSGDWEPTSFGEIFNYERPDNYIVKSVEYSSDFYTPVLTANKGFILGYTNEKNTFKEKCIIFDDFTLDNKYVDFHFMVKSSALKILTLRNKNIHNLLFSFNLLNTTKIEIMGHARHYISVVQNTSVLVPIIEEQQKIGKYFQNLENQIALHKTQLEKLNTIKKACFSKMFVAQD